MDPDPDLVSGPESGPAIKIMHFKQIENIYQHEIFGPSFL